MAKQINIDLVFNANTQQAKSQMVSLQNQLNQLQNLSTNMGVMSGFTKDVQQAQAGVVSLKANLQTAFNVETGRLDLTRFNQNLRNSGKTLRDYATSLQTLGPEGRQAFNQLTAAIVQGEMPLKRTKNLLTSIMDTFGSSIKWTIAYGAIDSIRQGFQDAFQYAKDLNESLTNIGVVAGKSTQEMSKFAEQANRAAKMLSSTTVAYSDAALIYYQQGLSDDQVAERAATTMKLANVVGESAATVSEWMTAIWNNFDDGSKKLEFYADVMAKLGAETASSADEIAQGFEKFAAVADTVGLSYEKGAAAIATVTATTRQSADVVGTAFKTLFARIQDLELGNTLDDGTTLGSYSEALNKVGINIKTTSGDLKEMDDILAEMGTTWKTLSNDEQVALAKSVAGIRQYTQLIALMDNYDYFEQLTNSAETAEGTLEEQQARWAESWEASSNRVKAASEGLYSNLINDEFFIDLNNIFADLLGGIDEFMDSIGGLKTLLPLIGGYLLQAFGPTMIGMISKFTTNLKGVSGAQIAAGQQLRKEALQLQTELSFSAGSMPLDEAQGAVAKERLSIMEAMEKINRGLNDSELQQIQQLEQEFELQSQIYLEIVKQKQALEEKNAQLTQDNTSARDVFTRIYATNPQQRGVVQDATKRAEKKLRNSQNMQAELDDAFGQGSKNENFQDKNGRFNSSKAGRYLKENLSNSTKSYLKNKGIDINKPSMELFDGSQKTGDIGVTAQLSNFKEEINSSAKKQAGARLQADVKKGTGYTPTAEDIEGLTNKLNENNAAIAKNIITNKKYGKSAETMGETLRDSANKVKLSIQDVGQVKFGEAFVTGLGQMANATAGLSMVISSVKSATNAITEGNFSFETFLSLITSIGFGLPMLINGLTGLSKGYSTLVMATRNALATKTLELGLQGKELTMESLLAVANKLGIELSKEETEELQKLTVEQAKQQLIKKYGLTLNKATLASQLKEIAVLKMKAFWEKVVFLWENKRLLKFALIIAAIVAVIAVIKVLISWYNKDAIAAEKAAENAKTLTEAYNGVKESYDNLKESLADYQEAENALAKLTKGSQEWKEALQEANESVLELIQTYPELAQYVERTADGQLKISKEGQQTVLDQQAANVSTAYNAQLDANLDAQRLKTEAKKTDMIRDELDTFSEWNIAGASTFGVGAGIAAIIENEKQANESERALDELANYDLSKIAEAYNEEGKLDNSWLQKELNISSELAKKMSENTDSVIELVKTNNALNETEKANNYAKMTSYLTAQGVTLSSQAGEALKDAASELYNNAIDLVTTYKGDTLDSEKWANDLFFGVGWGVGTDAGKNQLERYAEIMGWNYEGADFGATNATIKYKVGNDGETQEIELDYETIKKTLATAALNEDGGTAGQIAQLDASIGALISAEENKVDNAFEKEALGSFLNRGDFGVTEEKYFNTLRNTTSKERKELIKDAGITEQQLSAWIGADKVEAYGGDVWKAFEDSFIEASKNYKADQVAENIQAETVSQIQSLIAETATSLEITEEAVESYTAALIEENKNLKDNELVATQAAAAHWKLAKGLQTLQELYKNNKEALDEANKGTLDYYEAIGELQKGLEDTFGLNLSFDFVTSNLKTIKSALDGNIESLKTLREEMNKDFISNLELEDSSQKALSDELQRLSQEALDNDIGIDLTITDEQAISALNELMLTGKATKEEIESMFNNANLSMPELHYHPVPQTSTSTIGGKLFGVLPIPESTITTTTEVPMPYFGDTPPKIDSKGNFKSYGGSSSGSLGDITGIINNDSLEKSLDYKDEGKLESASDKKKRLKDLDNEIERYHEIDEAIENTERELDKLSKAKDRAFGKDKLAFMDMEIQKNRELLAEEQKRVKEAEKYYQQDRKQLLDNYAVKLDEEGNITNYNDIIESITSKMKGMDPESNAYSNMEDYLSNFKDDAAKYEESLDAIAEGQQKALDLQYELADQAMEKIEYKVSFEVEMSEDDMVYIDFLMSKIEDDAFAVAEKVKNQAAAVGVITEQIAATERGIGEIMADVNEQGFMTEAQAEQLREYRDNLIGYEAKLREIKTTVEESLTEAYDAWNKKLDENLDKFDHYNSVIESYRNIIDLVGKDTLGISNDFMREMSKMQVNNAKNLLSSSKSVLDARKAVLEDYKSKLAAATTDEDKKYWEEQVLIAEQQVQESTEDFMSNWENALSAAAEAFKADVELIVEEFEAGVSGIYGSLDELSEAFERQKEVNERYLADYEKTYEISKLNRQIEQSLDKTDNVANQKQLRKLQQELLDLQKDGVDVSERDIQYMQKRYDLMLAEQALKDAQNAKSVVRLRQDSEGNYGYTYTADQGAIDEAQQKYEGSLYALEKWSEDSLLIIQENIIATQQEFSEAVRQISADESLSIEEKEAKIAEITQYYTDKLRYWTEEGAKLTAWGVQMNSEYNTAMANDFKQTILSSLYPDQNSWESLYTESHNRMIGAQNDFLTALNGEGGYKETVASVFDAAGTSIDDFRKDAQKDLKTIQNESGDTADATDQMALDMAEDMDNAAGYVEGFQLSFSGKLKVIREDIGTTILSIDGLISKFGEMKKAADDAKDAADKANNKSAIGNNNTPQQDRQLTTTPPKEDTTPKAKYATGDAVHTNSNAEWYANNGTGLAGRSTSAKNTNFKILDSVYNKGIGEYTYKVKTASGYAWLSESDLTKGSYKDNRTFTITVDTSGVSGVAKKFFLKTYNNQGKYYDTFGYETHSKKSLEKEYGGAKILGYTKVDGVNLFKVKTNSTTKFINWTDLYQLAKNITESDKEKIINSVPYISLDTGGYTGSWGPEGKMAMLHQKEIVLNAQDTENFLAAIKIVRSMADQIEANALINRYNLSAYSASTVKPQGDTLEQNVTIHAEFPNATNHNEIEEAFRNLSNYASQYANRKN